MSFAQAENVNAKSINEIVDIIFLTHSKRGNDLPLENLSNIEEFTKEKLIATICTLQNIKAPGLAGILSGAIEIAARVYPELYFDIYNACLRTEIFCSR